MTIPWNDVVPCPDCGWTITLAGLRIPGHVARGHVRNPSARTLCSGVGYCWPDGSSLRSGGH